MKLSKSDKIRLSLNELNPCMTHYKNWSWRLAKT